MTSDEKRILDRFVYKYIQQKFGEHEAGKVVLSHTSLRYLVEDFALAWADMLKNSQAAPTSTEGADGDSK